MFYLRISILLLCVNLSISSSVCLSESPCKCVLDDKTTIDFSSVGSPEKPRFYEISFTTKCNKTEFYSYNPCYAFDSPDKFAFAAPGHTRCIAASACVKGSGGSDGSPPEEHAIGLQNTAVFDKNASYFYITYTVPGSKKILQVLLNCDNGGSADAYNLTMIQPECADSDRIVLELTSKCACPNGCPSADPTTMSPTPTSPTPTSPTPTSPTPTSPTPTSPAGLSTGSKLLIAFFTILLAYLLIGVVWNFCNGSKGSELIPNIEFWNDLPTLIMEGVVFTCSCCGRQSSYGEV